MLQAPGMFRLGLEVLTEPWLVKVTCAGAR